MNFHKRTFWIILITSVTSLLLLACSKDGDIEPQEVVIPKTIQGIDANVISKYPRLADLANIAIALEKYKQDHRSYPLSSGSDTEWFKKNWDSAIDDSGELKSEWINGLAPKYLPYLPVDPRRDGLQWHQYIYKSDGANYKLVVLNPEDCFAVKQEAPDFIDLRRGECKSYGFWTPRAVRWR